MLLQAKNPTFSFIMTLSNHPPYGMPETFMGPVNSSNVPSNLKEKILDEENFYKRIRAFAYADEALGLFLKKAKKESYFKETLFLITADHAHQMNLRWKHDEYYKLLGKRKYLEEHNSNKTRQNNMTTIREELWKTKGIVDIGHLNDKNKAALIIPDLAVPEGKENSPAFLVFENYEKILKWNRSLRFGVTVCTLTNMIKNEI